MLKVGLVGTGGISRAHIPAWIAMEETELVALCDIRPEMMEEFPDQRHYTDFEEMLSKEDLDILDICLPTYLHVDYAVKAMEKGIHVICEKPIALKEEAVSRAYEAAERNHVNFMIAQVLRFWPEYEFLKSLVDSGRYGKVLSGYMQRLGVKPKWSWDNWMMDPERSGMVPFDLQIHDLDFLVYAFGTPENVVKHRSLRPEQDYIANVYEYPGFFITVEAAWYAAPMPFGAGYRFQFEDALVIYEKGVCTVYQNDGTILDFSAAVSGQVDSGDVNLIQSDAYANEIRYFTDCVLANRFPDKVKAEELMNVIRILNSL